MLPPPSGSIDLWKLLLRRLKRRLDRRRKREGTETQVSATKSGGGHEEVEREEEEEEGEEREVETEHGSVTNHPVPEEQDSSNVS